MPGTVTLVVAIRTLPGLGHRQRAAFAALAPLVRAEPGCRRYDLLPVEGDADAFVLIEEWASREALDAHGRAPHMADAASDARTFRDGPATVHRLEDPIGVGSL